MNKDFLAHQMAVLLLPESGCVWGVKNLSILPFIQLCILAVDSNHNICALERQFSPISQQHVIWLLLW